MLITPKIYTSKANLSSDPQKHISAFVYLILDFFKGILNAIFPYNVPPPARSIFQDAMPRGAVPISIEFGNKSEP